MPRGMNLVTYSFATLLSIFLCNWLRKYSAMFYLCRFVASLSSSESESSPNLPVLRFLRLSEDMKPWFCLMLGRLGWRVSVLFIDRPKDSWSKMFLRPRVSVLLLLPPRPPSPNFIVLRPSYLLTGTFKFAFGWLRNCVCRACLSKLLSSVFESRSAESSV